MTPTEASEVHVNINCDHVNYRNLLHIKAFMLYVVFTFFIRNTKGIP